MAKMQDVRKTIEGSLGNLTPARAQEIAKSMLDRDAAKEQVSKTAADLMEWSQRNRNRLSTMIRTEVRNQLLQSGVATADEVNALRKRVRDLERAMKPTSAGRSKATGSKSASKAKGSSKRSTG
jgi:polyhydroxyalkanoate synthesis regulator phasin